MSTRIRLMALIGLAGFWLAPAARLPSQEAPPAAAPAVAPAETPAPAEIPAPAEPPTASESPAERAPGAASPASVVEIEVGPGLNQTPAGAETRPAASNLVSMTLDNVPVSDVVTMFAQISGANIIMAGAFTNLFITATLNNVDWKSALNLALGSVNLSMIEDPSGILMVVTSEVYPKKLQEIEATKPLVTRAITPKFLNPVDLVEQIRAFKVLSPRGTIVTSQSREQHGASLKSAETKAQLTLQNPSITTAIIVTDIKEYVDKVEALVRALDRREPQVFIEARIINVTSGDSKQLGFDWDMLERFGASAGLRDLEWKYADSHSVQNSTLNKFNQYDRRSRQDDTGRFFDLNGQPAEVLPTGDEAQEMANGMAPTRSILDKIGLGRDITSDKSDTVLDTMSRSRTATAFLTVDEVSLFLSALEKNANAEMISHPQIVVGNRVEAKIHVGEKYPVLPTITEMIPSGTGFIPKYSDGTEIILDLGLTLWVIPEIDFENNIVRLTVRPETSVQSGEVENPQTGKIYPIVASRDLTTRVNVPSGHTVAIGGLVENKVSKEEKKVPILGDIPLLGLLFRHTADVVSKDNLIILITPTILDDHKPVTGLEAVAQQTIDRLTKAPLSPLPGTPPGDPSRVEIGADGATPASGLAGPEPAPPPAPAAPTAPSAAPKP